MSDDKGTMTLADGPVAPRKGLFHRLDEGETTYPWVRKAWRGYAVSAVLVVVGVIALIISGLNLGIDFEGGVSWEVPAAGITTGQVEDVLANHDVTADRVQTLNSSSGNTIRVQAGPQDPAVQNAIRQEIADLAKVDLQEVSLNSVGPSWGDEITAKAVRALIVFLVLVSLYLAVRLEWRMALAALVAVAHDIVITVGIYALFQWDVTPATVIAFLTILGFSLYDTIVVFDKLHENVKRYGPAGRMTYTELVELSANQVLMRSISTSLAAVLPVLSLLIVGSVLMGAVALEDFSLALLVGLLAGSYSSLFLATPLVAALKEREARWRQVANRIGARTVPAGGLVGLAASSAPGGVPVGANRRSGAAAPAPGLPGAVRPAAGGAVIPPRPRKQKRR